LSFFSQIKVERVRGEISEFVIKPTIIFNLIACFIKKRTIDLQIIDYFGAIMLKDEYGPFSSQFRGWF
jgi:hypothetical protein